MCHSFVFFFFSSRRRHTRLVSDWSSDVCSSDLALRQRLVEGRRADVVRRRTHRRSDRSRSRSEERRVGKSVDLGGRRIIKKKKKIRLEKTRSDSTKKRQ